jgi:hypothetical protein
VREGTPAGHWKTLTILSAISIAGLVATMVIEAPTDGEVFLCYLEQVLSPQLAPGHIVGTRQVFCVNGCTFSKLASLVD